MFIISLEFFQAQLPAKSKWETQHFSQTYKLKQKYPNHNVQEKNHCIQSFPDIVPKNF